jgi:hypothetical protein
MKNIIKKLDWQICVKLQSQILSQTSYQTHDKVWEQTWERNWLNIRSQTLEQILGIKL